MAVAGLGRTARLLLRAPAGLFDLGGKLLGGRGQHVHHAFDLAGRLKHALGLGPFGPGLGLLGLPGGFPGRFGLPGGIGALGVGLGDLGLEVGHHFHDDPVDPRPGRIPA